MSKKINRVSAGIKFLKKVELIRIRYDALSTAELTHGIFRSNAVL